MRNSPLVNFFVYEMLDPDLIQAISNIVKDMEIRLNQKLGCIGDEQHVVVEQIEKIAERISMVNRSALKASSTNHRSRLRFGTADLRRRQCDTFQLSQTRRKRNSSQV